MSEEQKGIASNLSNSENVTSAILQNEYIHWSGCTDSPGADEMLPEIKKTHAIGYLRAGLATEAAVGEDGFLLPMIDMSEYEQKDIRFYLAINPDNRNDMSTTRVVSKKNIEDLPTYGLVKEGLWSEALSQIREKHSSGVVVQELAALANSEPRQNRGSIEILRKIVADSITKEGRPDRLLFCSMVDVVLGWFKKLLGDHIFQQIGSPVVLEENKYRKKITIVPVVIDPDYFIFNLLKASQQAEHPHEQKHYHRKALFFASLFPDAPQVPEEIRKQLK